MTHWMIQCSLNQTLLNDRRLRAMIAPRGRNTMKPRVHMIACATAYFWYGSSGGSWNVVSEPLPESVVLPLSASAIVVMGFRGSLSVIVRVFVRSSVVGPESRCCTREASILELPGFAEEYAQIMLEPLFEDAGIVNTSLGLLPVRSEDDGCAVAVRGGALSTVGITSPGALRGESVTVPSEFGHMMTMGVLAICAPKPLRNCVSQPTYRSNGKRNVHGHPTKIRSSQAL